MAEYEDMLVPSDHGDGEESSSGSEEDSETTSTESDAMDMDEDESEESDDMDADNWIGDIGADLKWGKDGWATFDVMDITRV